MKKLLLLLLSGWFLGSLPGLAQPKASGEPQKLIEADGQYFMQARWSPDGTQIGFAGEKYNSIWVSDARGRGLKKITDDLNSGFGFSWSEDGQSILARPAVEENRRRLHAVKLYDVGSGVEQVLVLPARELRRLPVWTSGDSHVAVLIEGNIRKVPSGKPVLKSSTRQAHEALSLSGELIAAVSGSGRMVDFPRFKGRYIYNAVVSPSGKKVVFQVNGLGLFVANTDGTGLKTMGRGEQASWMPGEKYVIVTLVEDDGETITKGELFAVEIETGNYSPLMQNEDVMALNPAVSPNGSELLFNNPSDGAIYRLKLSR